MGDDAAVSYTSIEIESYLPGGWKLVDGTEPGRWDDRKRRWCGHIQDPADQVWELVVTGKEAGRKGRIPALRESLDRLSRDALG